MNFSDVLPARAGAALGVLRVGTAGWWSVQDQEKCVCHNNP